MRETILAYRMIQPGDNVLVAVSGGPDSVALLSVLRALSPELGITLAVAHLNHMLRGQQAEEDLQFVAELAARWGFPFFPGRIPVAKIAEEQGGSIQTVAREVRYRFLKDTAKLAGCQKIALGHNRDDQAETVLMHFLRGSGLRGLTGIPPVRDGIFIRPLLRTSRQEIEAYLQTEGLPFRVDPSNLKTVYHRNELRLNVIPQLEKYNPALKETLARTAEALRADEELLTDLARQEYAALAKTTGEEINFSLQAFAGLPASLKRRLVRLAVSSSLPYEHVEKVLLLAGRKFPGRVQLPGGWWAERTYDTLRFTKDSREEDCNPAGQVLSVPGETAFAGGVIKADWRERPANLPFNEREAYFDAGQVPLPLVVRSRRPGDVIRLFGAPGRRKVKEVLIDCKIPRGERDRIPVVEAGGEILWLAGVRRSALYPVTPQTQTVLYLRWEKSGKSGNGGELV